MAVYRRDFFRLLEAGLTGLFFVQAVRFLYGTLYAHVGSAGLVRLTSDPAALVGQPGVISWVDVQVELIAVGVALLLPLLSIVLGRMSFGPALAAVAVAAGRVLLTANAGTPIGVMGAAVTAGAAGLYFTLLAVRRQGMLPVFFVVGFAGDQLVRLFGNTMDITWAGSFLETQTALSLGLFGAAVLAVIFEFVARRAETDPRPAPKGEISGWAAFALGGLLFLQFAALGLPNLVARHAGLDYTAAAPWLLVASLLPLVAGVRGFVRSFLAIFDGRYRGWVWLLMIALLVVIGYRFDGVLALWALIGAQFFISLTWWWVVQPTAGKVNFTGLAAIAGIALFLLLSGADFLTFEYGFIRGLQQPFADIVRLFRGQGMMVVLIACLLACLPAVLARKRLPWRGGPALDSLAAVALIVLAGLQAGALSRPVSMKPPESLDGLRVATLNLHGGYSLYFGSDLPGLAQQIRQNGIDVLLLQEVEGGRLVSFGVDQAAWLARELQMQVAYYPTVEDMHGLAILSRLVIEQEQGMPLPGQNKQTGLLFARLRAQDGGVLDVYNTQLTLLFRGGKLSIEEQQAEQNAQILGLFDAMEQHRSDPNRVVVGGNFNHLPGADIYLFMQQRGFIDPFTDIPNERAVTRRLVNEPPARVDYLWLHRISPRFVGVAPIAQSNHNLAIVELRIP